MTYANYVFGAYAVFVIVLAWEFVATRFRITRLMRKARLREGRVATRTARSTAGDAP